MSAPVAIVNYSLTNTIILFFQAYLLILMTVYNKFKKKNDTIHIIIL